MRSWLKWAGHVERMEGEQLMKKADAFQVEGRMRRGRLRLRWVDCVKTVGWEWRMRARDRGSGDGCWRWQ